MPGAIARKLIEAVADKDDELADQVSRGRDARPRRSSRRPSAALTCKIELVPVLCGSAFKNKGVQPLLDAVSIICRRRWTMPAVKGIDEDDERQSSVKTDDNEPFVRSRSSS